MIFTHKEGSEEEKEELKKIKEELEDLKGFLFSTFGFCGYSRLGGLIQSDDKNVFLTTDGYHSLNENKLPINRKEFNLLLEYLGIEKREKELKEGYVKINKRSNSETKQWLLKN